MSGMRSTHSLLAFALTACSTPIGDGPWDAGVELQPEPQLTGDAEAGYKALITENYLGCGIPYTYFDLLGNAAPVESEELLVGREGKAATLPYHWNLFETKRGVEAVGQNCLSCHAGHFDGQLVLGLGNAETDFTWDRTNGTDGMTLPEGWGTDAEREELELYLSRARALGPWTVMRTVGTNPAEMFAVTLMAHRDPETLAWSDEMLVEIPTDRIVVSDPPPWWRAKKKNALFYNGMARGDHRGTMQLVSSVCTDTIEEAERIDSFFPDIQEYIRSIEAPVYPRSIDAALSRSGKRVFTQNCAGCHGTYGKTDEDDTYPNLLFPLDVIGTDDAVAMAGIDYSPEMVDWYNRSWYGQITRMEPDNPFPGYMAPPLDGIWATGPFLHNGSVPTIELVLDSTARPTYWRRVDFDSANFDEDALGWPYEELAYGQDTADEAERKYIYDTTLFGHGNAGHTFGDHLTDDERRAVLEYLKTL